MKKLLTITIICIILIAYNKIADKLNEMETKRQMNLILNEY